MPKVKRVQRSFEELKLDITPKIRFALNIIFRSEENVLAKEVLNDLADFLTVSQKKMKEDLEIASVTYHRLHAVMALAEMYKDAGSPDQIAFGKLELFLTRWLEIDRLPKNSNLFDEAVGLLGRGKKQLLLEVNTSHSSNESDAIEARNEVIHKAGFRELAAINIDATFKLFPEEYFSKVSVGRSNYYKLSNSDYYAKIREYLDFHFDSDIVKFVLQDVLKYTPETVEKALKVLRKPEDEE